MKIALTYFSNVRKLGSIGEQWIWSTYAELECCISEKDTVIKILKLEQNKIFIFLWRWWSARNKINAGDMEDKQFCILRPDEVLGTDQSKHHKDGYCKF